LINKIATNKTKIIAEAGKHDFSIIREFDATIENVFRAFTNQRI
jgi:uncharacterized protein YndB with AHSA1/START domain